MKRILCGLAVLSIFGGSIERVQGDGSIQEPLLSTDALKEYQTPEVNKDSSSKKVDKEYLKNKTALYQKNSQELKELSAKGFSISKQAKKEFEKGSDKAVLKIDLFDSNNMKAALTNVFDFVLNENASSNFIMGEFKLPKNIKKNKSLYTQISELNSNLKNSSEKLGATEADVQMNVLKALEDICSALV